MFTQFKKRATSWIAGLLAHLAAPHQVASETGALDFYHPELEVIGNEVNCWRLRDERDRDYAHRIATEICLRLNKLDADLDRVCSYHKG